MVSKYFARLVLILMMSTSILAKNDDHHHGHHKNHFAEKMAKIGVDFGMGFAIGVGHGFLNKAIIDGCKVNTDMGYAAVWAMVYGGTHLVDRNIPRCLHDKSMRQLGHGVGQFVFDLVNVEKKNEEVIWSFNLTLAMSLLFGALHVLD